MNYFIWKVFPRINGRKHCKVYVILHKQKKADKFYLRNQWRFGLFYQIGIKSGKSQLSGYHTSSGAQYPDSDIMKSRHSLENFNNWILKPIQWINIRRNEVGIKMSERSQSLHIEGSRHL